ncbi:MAG: alpha/beta fold hydrolase [Polyangiaceae bacterium]|nr:alpha/beta fold hydrolase [Polyangiaceae bacterium]
MTEEQTTSAETADTPLAIEDAGIAEPTEEEIAAAQAAASEAVAAAEAADSPAAGAWRRIGHGLAWTGAAIGRAAAAIGRGVAGAYLAIDPDVRRHAAQLPLIGLTLLGGKRDAPVEPLPDDGHRPVVFIHGLQGHRGNFLPMQTFFRAVGRRRTYSVGLRPDAPLLELAADLARYVGEVIARNGLPEGAQVDLVAHSMGGLVARLALADEALRRRVRTIVTLGTPHSGTYAARFLATHYGLELRPGSETVEALRAQVPWRGPPEQPRLVALWSRSDMVLLPPEAARVEGAENVEAEGFTHFTYLLHPGGWVKVIEALGAAPRGEEAV